MTNIVYRMAQWSKWIKIRGWSDLLKKKSKKKKKKVFSTKRLFPLCKLYRRIVNKGAKYPPCPSKITCHWIQV